MTPCAYLLQRYRDSITESMTGCRAGETTRAVSRVQGQARRAAGSLQGMPSRAGPAAPGAGACCRRPARRRQIPSQARAGSQPVRVRLPCRRQTCPRPRRRLQGVGSPAVQCAATRLPACCWPQCCRQHHAALCSIALQPASCRGAHRTVAGIPAGCARPPAVPTVAAGPTPHAVAAVPPASAKGARPARAVLKGQCTSGADAPPGYTTCKPW